MRRGLYPIEGRAESATRLWPLGEYGHLHGLGHVQWQWEEGGWDYSLLCGVSAQSVAPSTLPALPYYAYVHVATSTAASEVEHRRWVATTSSARAPRYGPADSHLLRQLNATSRGHSAPEQSVTIQLAVSILHCVSSSS
jgi:hypothetical protein